MRFLSSQLKLYAITNGDHENLPRLVEDAVRGGATMVQYREKELTGEALRTEAKGILQICRKHHIPFIVNDDYRLALSIGADGVHVGMEDTPVDEIRRMTGKDFIIGATAKTVEQARAAEKAGAHYLGVGAIFPSPTKKNALRITPDALKIICSSVSIPAVAIGGITAENMSVLRHSGVQGIAVISALFEAADVEKEAGRLRQLADDL